MNAALANLDRVVLMSRSLRTHAHARRDAGLRRLRTLNRVLIGAAVAGTGLLTDVAANAFPGHKRHVTATAPSAATRRPARASTGGQARHRRRHHARRHKRAALRPPAQAPTTATATTPQPQVTTTSAAPAPAPQPAPAPAVSGGS
jgi:hypothetical protein